MPTNLKIEDLGSSWIVISWRPTRAATSYLVIASAGDREFNYTVSGTADHLNITGLNSSTEYTLWVVTVANSGETSSPSIAITAVTLLPGD